MGGYAIGTPSHTLNPAYGENNIFLLEEKLARPVIANYLLFLI
jgi:hypothetical protein